MLTRVCFSFSILLYAYIIFIAGACTTKTAQKKAQNSKNQVFNIQEQTRIQKSFFMKLTQDQSPIQQWEQSDAWVAYYQGHLHDALKILDEQAKVATTNDLIAHARIHLSLSETYSILGEMQNTLLTQWMHTEQKRPRADLHKSWYQWIHYSDQPSVQQKSKVLEDQNMSDWVTLVETPLKASVPDIASSAYKRWFRFYQLGLESKWEQASKHWKKLKLQKPILRVEGKDQTPELPVYDPRMIPSLQRYHAAMAMQISKDFKGWSRLLHAQALVLLHSYQKADQVLQSLLKTSPKSEATPSLLVLNSATQNDDLYIQALAYAALCAQQLKNKIQANQYLKQIQSFQYKSVQSPKKTMGLVQSVWYYWAQSYVQVQQKIPETMLDGRRSYIQKSLDFIKQKSKNNTGFKSLASLGIVERWADQLYFRLAQASIRTDQRVYAYNILKSIEDLTATMRVQGRNRLNRLILISFNQLKMNRYRVTSKYLNRIRKDIPAVKFLIEMTSDLLSVKAFLNQEKVNAGQ